MKNTKTNMKRFPTSILQRCQNIAFSLYEGLSRRADGGFVLPSFQRGEVWTAEQKIRFVESLILKLPVGSYCVHEDLSTDVRWELLDGQQRWSAIFDYVDDKFSVFGLKYSELNEVELRYFKSLTFPVFIATGFTEEEKYELFTRLAYGGTPNSVDDAPTKRTRLA